MTEDKTAIELIYEMHAMLESLDSRMSMLEKNVLILNDKFNGELLREVRKGMPMGLSADTPSAENEILRPQGPTVIGPDRLKQNPQPKNLLRQNVKVTGKFLDMRQKPIFDIEVTIIDANNTVLKQTKTNRAGQWISFLPPGQYSAEFVKEGMAPQFKTFQLIEGQTEVEVN